LNRENQLIIKALREYSEKFLGPMPKQGENSAEKGAANEANGTWGTAKCQNLVGAAILDRQTAPPTQLKFRERD
jgi:hypothetical protein